MTRRGRWTRRLSREAEERGPNKAWRGGAELAWLGPALAKRAGMGRDAVGSQGMHGAAGAVIRTLVDSLSERPADASYASVSRRRSLQSTPTDSSSLACTSSVRSSSDVQKGAVSIIRMLTRVQRSQVVRSIFSSNSLASSRKVLRLQWMKVTTLPQSAEQRTSSLSEVGAADSSAQRQATTSELTFSISRLITSVTTLAFGSSDWKVSSIRLVSH